MGDPRGFVTIRRADPKRRPVAERTHNWQEFYEPVSDDTLRAQGARCMDCGVPFCQGDTGCPVLNVIPEWNDLVYQGRWQDALKSLHATNNFPEFTGRLCPAPCESACVLGIIDKPVAIRNIEQAIADRGFAERWIVPVHPTHETGKRVAVVGSGPAGLAAAQQLRRMGHQVVVFEKADRIGGLLRYGIPDFKMEKSVLDQRLEQMTAEGVVFKTGVEVGVDLPVEKLRAEFDAVLLAGGAMQPRDLPVPGRELTGVHFAMDYLTQQNKRGAGDTISAAESMDASGKAVIVIGGGDTGSDCIGTCHRQGARSVYQLEILPQPPDQRDSSTPWPYWPMQLRSSHAHEEGAERQWSVLTTKLSGENGVVKKLHAVRVELKTEAGRSRFQEMPGSAFTVDAELVLLAMGFTGTSKDRLYGNLGIELDARGNVPADANYMTPVDGVFAAGDTKRGASLIVWAIREGRDAAREINRYLAEGRVGKTTGRPTHLRMVNA